MKEKQAGLVLASSPVPPGLVQTNPVWAAATGPQSDITVRCEGSALIRGPNGAFAALHDANDLTAWHSLRTLLAAGEAITMLGAQAAVPPDWRVLERHVVFQLVAGRVPPQARDVVPVPDDGLAPRDVRTGTPGPPAWTRRIGLRRWGRWSVVGGERLRTRGWREIAVAGRSSSLRGRIAVGRLAAAVAQSAQHRGHHAFVHVAAEDLGLLCVLQEFGFRVTASGQLTRLVAR